MLERREKIKRILTHYAVPSYGRTVSKIAGKMPLEWFTLEQLEDIACVIVREARFSASMVRKNRAAIQAIKEKGK